MRILHVIFSKDYGGAEHVAADMANRQTKNGHAVCLVVRPQKSKSSSIYNLISSNVPTYCVGKLWQWIKILWIVKKFNPDIIHTHLGKSSRLLGKMRKLGIVKIPVVSTIHIEYRIKDYALVDGLICLNKNQQNEAEKLEFSGYSQVIGNWYNSDLAAPSFIRKKLRHSLEIKENDFVIGSVSRLHKEKGIDVLIKAFEIADIEESSHLIIIGEGEQYANLKARVQGIKSIKDRVKFIPFQQDVTPYYQAFDVFVSASCSEAFGMTLLEAMAAKCPIISTNTLGAQIVLKNQNSEIVPINNAKALATALKKEADKGQTRTSYNMDLFSPSVKLREIELFYCKLLS